MTGSKLETALRIAERSGDPTGRVRAAVCLKAAEPLMPEAPDDAEQLVDLVGPAWRAMFLSGLADVTHDPVRAERLIRRAAAFAEVGPLPEQADARTNMVLRLARQLMGVDRRRAAALLEALPPWPVDDLSAVLAETLRAMAAGGRDLPPSLSEDRYSSWVFRDVVKEVAKVDLDHAERIAAGFSAEDWMRARIWAAVITAAGKRDPGRVSRLADGAEMSLLGRLLRDDVVPSPEVPDHMTDIAVAFAPFDPDRAEAIVRRTPVLLRDFRLFYLGEALVQSHPARAIALHRGALDGKDRDAYLIGRVAKLSVVLDPAGGWLPEIVDLLTRMVADGSLAEAEDLDLTLAAAGVAEVAPDLALRLVALAEEHVSPDDSRWLVIGLITVLDGLARADAAQAAMLLRKIRDHLDRVEGDKRRYLDWRPLAEAVAAMPAEPAARLVAQALETFTESDREVLLPDLAPGVAVSDLERAQELADDISDDDERHNTYIAIASAVLALPK